MLGSPFKLPVCMHYSAFQRYGCGSSSRTVNITRLVHDGPHSSIARDKDGPPVKILFFVIARTVTDGSVQWMRLRSRVSTTDTVGQPGVDDVVRGGGNAKKLKGVPVGCRAGHNANALLGGISHVGREF